MKSTHPKLGEILLAQGIVSEPELWQALAIQQKTGGRLGDIIIAKNFTSYLPLYGAVAEHYNLPFINLIEQPPEKNLLNLQDAEDYVKYRAIPWRYTENGKIIVTLAELSDETKNWISYKYGKNVDFAITSPWDIRKIVEREFGVELEEKSCLQLWKENPKISARFTISKNALKILYFFLVFASLLIVFFSCKNCNYFYRFLYY